MLRITIPNEVQKTLRRALDKAANRECGGVLMGEHVDVNHFAVRAVEVQKPGAVAYFVRRVAGAVKSIGAFCRANGNDFTRFNYLGEWHSHPHFSVKPSSRDHATMREIAMDEGVRANFVVLLIFRLNGSALEGSAHTYLPDGSSHRSVLELEQPR